MCIFHSYLVCSFRLQNGFSHSLPPSSNQWGVCILSMCFSKSKLSLHFKWHVGQAKFMAFPVFRGSVWVEAVHPLLKTTLTGLRRTYLGFLVFRPKLGETKRFPPILDHMNGNFFLGGSRFLSGKIGLKLAVGGSRPHTNSLELYWKLIVLAQKTALFGITWPNIIFVGQIIGLRYQIFGPRCQISVKTPIFGIFWLSGCHCSKKGPYF